MQLLLIIIVTLTSILLGGLLTKISEPIFNDSGRRLPPSNRRPFSERPFRIEKLPKNLKKYRLSLYLGQKRAAARLKLIKIRKSDSIILKDKCSINTLSIY